jgi:hypothetical protein
MWNYPKILKIKDRSGNRYAKAVEVINFQQPDELPATKETLDKKVPCPKCTKKFKNKQGLGY